MEYKLLTPELTFVDGEDTGELSGYASTFANWDMVGERPAKGAFAPHLADFLLDGFISVGHDWDVLPVATPTEAFEDDHGLFVRAAFHSTQQAQQARTVVKERLERGKSVKLSIGYEVLADEYTQEGRILKDVKLFEYSIVTVPANPLAAVVAAKGQGMPMDRHTDAVLAAVSHYTERMRELHTLRSKEGRVLSDTNRKRIAALKEALAAVLGDLDALLAATEPKSDPKALQSVYLEFQRLSAQLNGVQL